MGLLHWLFTRRYKAERLRSYLENNTWIEDSGNSNLAIYVKAARFLGITKPIHSWTDLGKSLGMRTAWGMPSAVQEALFSRIAKRLKVAPLPMRPWEKTPRPDIDEIAKKLGLNIFGQIPKDFIAFAFVEYMTRQ